MKRKIIEIDESKCNGCGQCVEACAEGAIQLVNGKAKLVADNYCDGLAACVGECPVDALKIVEREAKAFDPEAVERYLAQNLTPNSSTLRSSRATATEDGQLRTEGSLPYGCPSTKMEMFGSPCEAANQPVIQSSSDTALTHWPVQIKLVPAFAPFLQKAHLLVASDCTPVAYPDFHKDFLKGRAVLVGCPKFDDTAEYINKFSEIFRIADIQSVTILIMEVPCCSKIPMIIQEGMALAGKNIPTEIVVVSWRGTIIKRDKLAA
jgi:Pyruvate/2-oxoacid:ferredoxin oxidoreductase delta subunit